MHVEGGEPPLTLEITCGNYGLASKLNVMPGTERLAERVIAYRCDSYDELYRALTAYSFLAVTSIEPGTG